MRLGSIVIRCRDFEAMSRFWQAALRYVPREAPQDGWVVLTDPNGPKVNLSLQRERELPVNQNLIHLDLYSDDQAGEVQRLLALGATRHPRANATPDEDFVVLADPDGNLFCVVQKRARG